MVATVNKIDRYVGNRVKAKRELLGISEATAAAALGMATERLRELEHGIVRFGASDLQRLTRLFNVSVAYFFESWLQENVKTPGNPDGERVERRFGPSPHWRTSRLQQAETGSLRQDVHTRTAKQSFVTPTSPRHIVGSRDAENIGGGTTLELSSDQKI